jgi:transposase InsO family protein
MMLYEAMDTPPPMLSLTKIRWSPEKARRLPWVSWKGNQPYVEDRAIVMPDQVEDVLRSEYRNVPPTIGAVRWVGLLEKKYVGIRRRMVKAFLSNQEAHQLYRKVNRASTTQITAAKTPLRRWQVDYGNFGKEGQYTYQGITYVSFLVIVDTFTKLCFLYPVRAESAEETIRVCKLWLTHLDKLKDGGSRMVKVLQSDNGSSFNESFTKWLETRGIKHVRGRPYNAQSQGQAERMIQTTKGYLRSFAEQKYPKSSKLAWPLTITQTMDAINNGWSRVLNMSPMEALIANTGQIRAKIAEQTAKRSNTYLYMRDPLKPGDKVRISLRVVGSAEIKAQIKNRSYKASNRQWDDNIYTVESRYGKMYYYLEEVTGRWNRSDLLRVASGSPESYAHATTVSQDQVSAPPGAPTRRKRKESPVTEEEAIAEENT